MKSIVLALVLFIAGNVFAVVHGNLDGNNIKSTSTMEVMSLQVGNISSALAYTLEVSGATSLDGAVTINESSADVNFRVESNGDTNAIFVDASTDRVGILNQFPTTALDVTGTINASVSVVAPLFTGVVSQASTIESAIALKAPIASPVLTGTAEVPALKVNTNQLFIDQATHFNGIGTAAPTVALDVVGEIKSSVGITAPTFTGVVSQANTIEAAIDLKAPIASPVFTGGATVTGALEVTGTLEVTNGITIGTLTPGSSKEVGTTGEVRWDGDYIYIMTGFWAADTKGWKRVALNAVGDWP